MPCSNSPAESRPQVQVYDTGVMSVDQALRTAHTEGADFVVGPLTRQEVDIAAASDPGVPMLALNFLSTGRAAPSGMNQFALSPEEEARELARRMLAAGQKRGVALSPTGDWGTRVLAAFKQELLAGGGTLLAQSVYLPSEHDFETPIRTVLGTDQSYARRLRLQAVLGQKFEFEPRGRADIDFIFMAAQSAQARLLRPQLRFQYAGDVPVYATSDAYAPEGGVANQDLDGLIVPAMPWLVPDSGAASALRATLGQPVGRQHGVAVGTLCLRLRRLPARDRHRRCRPQRPKGARGRPHRRADARCGRPGASRARLGAHQPGR